MFDPDECAREALEWRDAKIAYLERSLREANAAHEANTALAISARKLLKFCARELSDAYCSGLVSAINDELAKEAVLHAPAALECAVLDALKSLLKRLGPGYYEIDQVRFAALLAECEDYGMFDALFDALNAWTKELPDDLA